MTEPHPFARFIKILGRGKTLTRSLTIEEAEEAMGMIVAGEVLPEQIGAFLMLLRIKEESGEEIAGFVRAVRASMKRPSSLPVVDVDWSSYAGKRRQLPWFILVTQILARNGWRVFMHGTEGHTAGRLYTREALARIGFPVAGGFSEAAAHIAERNFAYLPLEHISPKLAELIELRPILGLRSPVHTLARMINPFDAPCAMQAVFHPGYMKIHRDAALLLGMKRMSVFRGEGGEIERRPNKSCDVMTIMDGTLIEDRWPAILPDPRLTQDESMDLDRMEALWRGEVTDDYAVAAVTGTLAIALKTMGIDGDCESAQKHAEYLWSQRDRSRLAAVA